MNTDKKGTLLFAILSGIALGTLEEVRTSQEEVKIFDSKSVCTLHDDISHF